MRRTVAAVLSPVGQVLTANAMTGTAGFPTDGVPTSGDV